MKLNPTFRTRTVAKPLKVTLTNEEIMADLQYPVAVDRARESRQADRHREIAR